jgi:hypothetical protein
MLQHLFMQVLVLIMTLTTFGSSVDVHATIIQRQAQIPATPPVVIPMPTTTSSFDYWWPYPPAGASTTMIPSAQSTVVQPSSSLSATIPTSVTGSIPSASSSSSLQPSSSSNTAVSSNALPTTQTALHPVHPKFKLYYLYPVFGVVGILIIALAVWIIYGCCTRKPRTRDHSDANSILGGPRYVAVDEKVLRDVEAGDTDAMQEHQRRLELRNKEDGQFKWPSYDLTDYWNGDRREKKPFLRPPLPTAKSSSDRTAKSARTTKTSRSTRTSTSTRPGSKKTQSRARNGVFSPKSDSTSLACLELYSSDEEAEEKAKQVPWESLRHKSIKRGILDQVRKDGSWRDSVRAVAGSAFADKVRAGLGGGVGNVERPNAVSRRSTGDASTYPASEANGGASSTRANSTRTTTTNDEGEGRWLKGPGFRMITESPAPSPPALLNAFGYGQDDVISEDDEECDDENDRFTPMPTRLGSSRSRSNSKSSSPVKSKPIPNKPTTTTIVRANLGGTTTSIGRQFVHPRDVLPKSPPQIMSPPLESQLCFTPTAAATARMQKNVLAPTRTRTIPKPKPSTKLRPSQPSLLPMPEGLGGHTAKTLVKRPPPPPSPAVEVGKEPEKAFPFPFTPDSEEGASKETMEEAMRTIEKIVEASWSARDLERQVAGSLSPNGVGSRA